MVIHTGLKSHQCPLCPFRCARKDNLKSHMKVRQYFPSPDTSFLFHSYCNCDCNCNIKEGVGGLKNPNISKTGRVHTSKCGTFPFSPGTSAPGPGRDLSVWTLPLYLIPTFQPEAPHALPPALPPLRSQGERGADHRHGGRRLPDGWQRLGRPEGDRTVPAAVRLSAADVASARGLLQSHPHQGGAAGKGSLRALALQHVQGPSQ